MGRGEPQKGPSFASILPPPPSAPHPATPGRSPLSQPRSPAGSSPTDPRAHITGLWLREEPLSRENPRLRGWCSQVCDEAQAGSECSLGGPGPRRSFKGAMMGWSAPRGAGAGTAGHRPWLWAPSAPVCGFRLLQKSWCGLPRRLGPAGEESGQGLPAGTSSRGLFPRKPPAPAGSERSRKASVRSRAAGPAKGTGDGLGPGVPAAAPWPAWPGSLTRHPEPGAATLW